jgi:hypothetical protein
MRVQPAVQHTHWHYTYPTGYPDIYQASAERKVSVRRHSIEQKHLLIIFIPRSTAVLEQVPFNVEPLKMAPKSRNV